MDEEYSKVTMVDQLAIAVSSPKNYKHLTKLKASKTVGFMILIAFILTFIEFGIGVITFIMHVGGLNNLITNKVPQFVIEDGKLTAESEMSLDIGNATIYMNTDYDRITLDDIKTNGVYIAFGKENVVMGMINGGQTYEYSTMDLDKLFYDGFNNDQLASAVPAFYVAIVIMYIAIMFGSVIKMIFLALVFSIVARTLAKGLHTGLSYGNVFRVCLYGLTLPIFADIREYLSGLPDSIIDHVCDHSDPGIFHDKQRYRKSCGNNSTTGGLVIKGDIKGGFYGDRKKISDKRDTVFTGSVSI